MKLKRFTLLELIVTIIIVAIIVVIVEDCVSQCDASKSRRHKITVVDASGTPGKSYVVKMYRQTDHGLEVTLDSGTQLVIRGSYTIDQITIDIPSRTSKPDDTTVDPTVDGW